MEPEKEIIVKKLYPYQQDAVDKICSRLKEIEPNQNILFQLPTGGGKTIIFSEIVKWYINTYHRKVLILTHRIELCKQTSDVLQNVGILNKIINADVKQLPQNSQYQSFTALVETLNNRLQEDDQFVEDIGLVIVDEAHYNSFRKLFHYFEKVNILGVTATPLSSNKKLPLYQTYKEIIVGESIAKLIKNSYLANGITYSQDVNLSSLKVGNNGEFTTGSHEQLYTQAIMQNKLIDCYEEIALNTKTLIFNAGILASISVYRLFKEKGYPVKYLDSTFSDRDRYETLNWFKETPNGILSSVSILTTGFDEPEVKSIILNRATRSLTLYQQMIGRGSRYLKHKTEFNIIDLGNNARRFNLWQHPIDWNHVFMSPHLYLDSKYKEEWNYEAENDYDLPDDIKARFLNSSSEAFIVKDKYMQCLRKGLKPALVLDQSLDNHFGRIKDNAADFDEAFELFNLLNSEMRYRIKQFAKCINATENYIDYQHQTYTAKLRRMIIGWFVE